ncbi:head maturation protease, ClpP-related [Alkalibacillus almallahensis]|uniref:head maturation protease, ClpP-related n=1 Tax=Alkalibacillus almallahensis TaxID=1379154 RepID=UPI00141DE052|nr:head maturation protease, ClpP-related [Alkalibacillus almallahensis]
MNATVPAQKHNQLVTIKNLTDKSADLYIYGEIVDNTDLKFDEADVMPDDVLNALNQVDGLDELNIYINSPGGSVFAGLAIYNMLSRNKAKKHVYVDGVAASMASSIALVGDTIQIPSNAFMMIHKPLTIAIGNANDFRKLAEDLDTIESGLTKIYEDNLREGVQMDTIKQMMDDETWLNGEDAAKYFNVEVIESKQYAASSRDVLQKYENTPRELLPSDQDDNTLVVANMTNEQKQQFINQWQQELNSTDDRDDKLKIQNEIDLLSL